MEPKNFIYRIGNAMELADLEKGSFMDIECITTIEHPEEDSVTTSIELVTGENFKISIKKL